MDIRPRKPRGGARLDPVGRPRRRSLNKTAPLTAKEGRRKLGDKEEQMLDAPARAAQKPSRKSSFDLDKIKAEKKSKKRQRRFSFKPRNIVKRSAQLLVIGVVFYAGLIGYKLFTAAQNAIVDRGEGAIGLQGDLDPNQLKGEGDGRVNILVIGTGGEGHEGANLADVNMVVSVDPTNNQVSMLSIPRDLYLRIPGYYTTRINAAYALGESDPETTGAAVLTETVEGLLDVDIHYFVAIDFKGFIEVVDRLGGITVDVPESINDPFIESSFGSGKNRFKIAAGEQYMDGATALQYARSRKTTSDFDRARRQQIVMQAVKQKVLSLGTFSNPLKLADLIDAVGSHVRTDIQIGEMLRMIEIAQSIDDASVRTAVLDNAPDGLLAAQNISGAAVLIPRAGLNNFSQIQRFVKSDLFADGFITKENASITVLNGTNVAGLAGRAADELEGLGYKITEVANANTQGQETTAIYDNSGGALPFTIKLLENRFGVSSRGRLDQQLGQTGVQDIVIVLGQDYANQR